MTPEQRKEAARAKLAKLKEATQSKGVNRMDWRPRAKIYLHPDTEIYDRRRHWFSKEVEDKDEKGGKKKSKLATFPYNCPGEKKCAFCALRSYLRDHDEIDNDEVILAVGQGKAREEYVKGEILGLKDQGYDYRRDLYPRGDFVCAAVMVENSKKERPTELKLEVFSGAKALGKEIRKEIETEVDERGDEGNPFFSPYPFLIQFDESESGSDMYSAKARPSEHPDDAIQAILDSEPPDFSDEIKPGDPDAILAVVEHALVREGIKLVVEGCTFVPPGEQGSTASEPEEESEPEEVEVEEEVEIEPEPPKAASKPVVAPRSEPAAESPAVRAARAKAQAAKAAAEAARLEAEAAEAEAQAQEKPKAEPEPKPEEKPKSGNGKAKTEAKPRTTKKEVKPAEEKKLAWEPKEGEEFDICPKCRQKIPTTATECPHPGCGAKYSDIGQALS